MLKMGEPDALLWNYLQDFLQSERRNVQYNYIVTIICIKKKDTYLHIFASKFIEYFLKNMQETENELN